MEHWQLEHPEHGRLEVCVGRPEELAAVDPGFSCGTASAESDEDVDAPRAQAVDERTGASPARTTDESVPVELPDLTVAKRRTADRLPLSQARQEALRAHLGLDEAWSRQGLTMMRDGVVFARMKSIANAKIRLTRSTPDGHFTEHTSTTAKPRVEVIVNPLRGHVTDLQVRDSDGVTVFEAPEGSPAARRYAAMDSSPVKRVLYPMLGGLGRSGWAIGVLVLGPLVSRALAWIFGPLIAWLLSLLPHIDWPDIPWPNIHFPHIPWPHVHLPSIPWPHLPSWTPPGWLAWLLEHPKVWLPIVGAAFWGATASRNRKRSERKKAEWAKRHAYARLASDLRTLERRRGDGSGSTRADGASDPSS